MEILNKKDFSRDFNANQQAVEMAYYNSNEKFFDYTQADSFQLDKIDGLFSIDNENILNTKLIFTWIGFPGWKTVYSIDVLAKNSMMTVRMLHRIRDAIDDKSYPYSCYAAYQGLQYECPGAKYCPYYHEEDVVVQLQLLQA